MVQATENAHGDDPADPLDRSIDWGVLVQRQVRPQLVVIRHIGRHDTAGVSLAEHDEAVETLSGR